MNTSADLHPHKMLKSGTSSTEALELGPTEGRRTRVDLIAEDPVMLSLGSQIPSLGCRRSGDLFCAWWQQQLFEWALW